MCTCIYTVYTYKYTVVLKSLHPPAEFLHSFSENLNDNTTANFLDTSVQVFRAQCEGNDESLLSVHSAILTRLCCVSMQGPEHPNSGKPFTARGFPRHCYLPDSEKGRKVHPLPAARGCQCTMIETRLLSYSKTHSYPKLQQQA